MRVFCLNSAHGCGSHPWLCVPNGSSRRDTCPCVCVRKKYHTHLAALHAVAEYVSNQQHVCMTHIAFVCLLLHWDTSLVYSSPVCGDYPPPPSPFCPAGRGTGLIVYRSSSASKRSVSLLCSASMSKEPGLRSRASSERSDDSVSDAFFPLRASITSYFPCTCGTHTHETHTHIYI